MNFIGLLDWLAAAAALVGILLLIRRWRKAQPQTRSILLGLLLLMLFDSASNALEWSGITAALDDIEDYLELLRPVLWGVLLADLLRVKVERDLLASARRLQQERDLVSSIAETSPAGIVTLNLNGEITYANDRAEAVLKLERQDILTRKYNDPTWQIVGLNGKPFPAELLPFALVKQQGKAVYDVRHALRMPDGSKVALAINAAPLLDEAGKMTGVVTTIEDISERQRIEAALFEEKERAQVTLQSISDAVITTDAQGQVEFLNSVAETLTEWRQNDAHGKPLWKVFNIVDEQNRSQAPDLVGICLKERKVVDLTNQVVLISRYGKEYDIDSSASPILSGSGDLLGAVLVFRDVTRLRRLARQMAYDASHDMLTGLVNRREFERRIERALVSAKQRDAVHTLCYLDLDQFKIVNDTVGHMAGDELLKQVAHLLSGIFRQRDTFARLGGDEFGLLLENCPLDQAVVIANDVISRLREKLFTWEGKSFQINVSIGMVPITALTQSSGQALSQADVACYTAKDLGRGRIHIYHLDDSESAQRHGELFQAARLRDVVENDQFQLYCQPIMPLFDDPIEPVHYEILIRLIDDGRVVLPSMFIPSAERYGLMAAIDRWVIRTTFQAYAARFKRRGVNINLNLSGNSLNDETLLDYVQLQFNEHGIQPDQICFEITETAAIQHLNRAQVFAREVRLWGCKMALDDFGSGLSSFRYLKMLPVDFLKIDGSFVQDILESKNDYALVAAINQLAHMMGIKTVAEHVANMDIAERLREMKVDYAQGYGLGRPMPLLDAWTWRTSQLRSYLLTPAQKDP